jgi:hypothetical protein
MDNCNPIKVDCDRRQLASRIYSVLVGPCGGRCMDSGEDVAATVRELLRQFEPVTKQDDQA